MTEVIKADLKLDEATMEGLRRAANIIRSGGLVVFPTETVYGLGADATNSTAASEIYKAKGRPSDNPLIIHISKPEDASLYTYTNELYFKIAKAFMPGPITVVLPVRDNIPEQTRASLPTVAVRCPSHPIANKLIELAGVPVAAPSANISGRPSPTKSLHVIDDMTDRVDMIIDGGDSEVGIESTIVKIEDDALILLRPGKITVDELRTVCDKVTVSPAVTEGLKEGERVISPGMKYRHYAPKSPVYLIDADIEKTASYLAQKATEKNIAYICYEENINYIKEKAPNIYIYRFGEKQNDLVHAHLLFEILRDADKRDFDEIYAPLPEKTGVGLALYNRMIRAAAYNIIRM